MCKYQLYTNNSCNPITSFSTFIKKIEEVIDLTEAARYPNTPQQIVAKDFNCIIKVQFLLDTATREYKRVIPEDKS